MKYKEDKIKLLDTSAMRPLSIHTKVQLRWAKTFVLVTAGQSVARTIVTL